MVRIREIRCELAQEYKDLREMMSRDSFRAEAIRAVWYARDMARSDLRFMELWMLLQAGNLQRPLSRQDGHSAHSPLLPPNPPYTPVDMRIGWMALFRETDLPDLWWDGNEWLEQEVHIDLSGYRTAAAQDELDATLAPLHSPVFTGIPQVTVPDYTVPLQAVPVSELVYVLETVTSLLYGKRRIFERGIAIRPVYREMERGGMKRKTERAAI